MMNSWKRIAGGVALSAISAVLAQPSFAQVTTSGVHGVITNADGTPAPNASVTVIDTRSGLRRDTNTDVSGAFDVRNLAVGGPYSVSVQAPDKQPTRLEGVFLTLGQEADVNLAFSGETSSDVVVVSATRETVGASAIGPAATFDLAQLQDEPAANRDIKDIIRMDPRVYMDEAFVDSISCAGANPRYNSLTVDGVRLNDDFGLNSNGYPTERMPFSYDAIQQVSVELAPFDVMYGQFTACTINAVTKSGGNNFHGGAFFDYTSDNLTGKNTDGIKRDLGNFDEKRYGLNIGGPIIQDKLFFFAAYEKFEGANIFGYQPADVGLTDAAYQQVIDIATNQYGYKAGGLPTSIPVTDEKFFAKIDWNISDRHRAVFTYDYNDGDNFNPSDNSSSQISDGNHYYDRGATLNAYTGSLYSDWTDNFSTEARVSYLKLDNRQIPVAGLTFGEVQVRVPKTTGGSSTVYIGADDSRQANKLNYEEWNYKLAGTYKVGAHALTAGFERQEFSVFNLFVQQPLGEWHFSSPADFANGDFNFFQYTNAAGTNNVDDGAAKFGYEVNTAYVQDKWQPTSKIDIVAGLRYDWYTSGDKPRFNQAFQTKYGFRNDSNMDGRSLLQPRVGATFDVSNNLQIHAGAGLFSGGNPNVWISNNYSNNGVTLADYYGVPQGVATMNLADFTYPGTGTPFQNVPQQAIDAIANATGAGNVNALDPDFKIPSEWKFDIGAVWDLNSNIGWIGNDWRLTTDYYFSKTHEAAVVVPLGYTQTGNAPDGRPIYGGNTNDFLLTNAYKKGSAQVASIAVQKSYDNGIDWTLGYAYTYAKDLNPMTSSVAYSNFTNVSTSDPLHMDLATSDYQIAHRFTFALNWKAEFIRNYATKVSLFGTAHQGPGYSYTFAYNNMFETPYKSSRQLAYLPTGVNDPLISPNSDPNAVQQLVNFIDSNDRLKNHKGEIAARNIGRDDWWGKLDLKLTQEFPGFMGGDHFEGFLVINNLTNLLNNRWGILREHGFPGNAELYTATIENGQYNISSFSPSVDKGSIQITPSLWQVHVGINYKF
ncbi:MAG: TonB-dependent receptor plug domain-containing protein [Alphaproteobacteria bacterium]|nr:TonB-dependent receptor plug domain-containing protein [Alphaproteobacteria bacterium]